MCGQFEWHNQNTLNFKIYICHSDCLDLQLSGCAAFHLEEPELDNADVVLHLEARAPSWEPGTRGWGPRLESNLVERNGKMKGGEKESSWSYWRRNIEREMRRKEITLAHNLQNTLSKKKRTLILA